MLNGETSVKLSGMKKMNEQILLETEENFCSLCGTQLTESSSYTTDGEWESATIECLNCGEVVREV